MPVLAREKDTDAAIPREAIADRQFTCPRVCYRIPSHAAFREAPIRTIVPSNKHSPTEILAGLPFYGTLDEGLLM